MDETITVTLFLEGGHQQTLDLDVNSVLLRRLFSIMVDPIEERSHHLFQIPLPSAISGQESALCFSGDRLVALTTHPPIYIEDSPEPPATKPVPATPKAADPPLAQPIVPIIPTRYVQLEKFLPEQTCDRLLNFVLTHQDQFVGSSTSTDEADYRKSWVLYSIPDFEEIIRQTIHGRFLEILTVLDMEPFEITAIEAQLTAHNDGHYYRIHNDNGSPETATRTLTYVYYFHQSPKAFTGGQLQLFDSRIENNFYVKADSYHLIEPNHNSIVFFPSHCMHEVLPIQCPSRSFANSRFTINGWVRR